MEKKWYKRWWAITIWVILILGFIGSFLPDEDIPTQVTQTKLVESVLKELEQVKVVETIAEEEPIVKPKAEPKPIVKPAVKPIEVKAPSFTESLRKLQNSLEEIQIKNTKLDMCTELCAGEDSNIPAVKDAFYASCYDVYYYGGEEALDDLITDCQG